jgi:ubiquinone/menaquinone biosynthesis C-methylase UbiE
VKHALTREDAESAIKARGADVYAAFLLRYIRPDMAVLDCGCGEGTITVGLAEAVPEGRVVGIDFRQRDLFTARRYATALGIGNLSWCAADASRIPFCDAQFDAVLCHSVLETVDTPISVVSELRRVTKHGGLVGAASVDYGGLILGGEKTSGPQRFYEIRQQLWRSARIAEPNTGRRLRGLFEETQFNRVEAFADYISYGTPDRVRAFACDRAMECRNQELHAAVQHHGIAATAELLYLASAWEDWGNDAGAFFAFAWCRVLAWR